MSVMSARKVGKCELAGGGAVANDAQEPAFLRAPRGVTHASQ